MSVSLIPQIISMLVLFALATLTGVPAVARLIRIYEAKHELRHGSAGFLRGVRGWSLVLIWLMAIWFCATIIGDWGVSGDLSGAVDRGWLRLRIIIEIALAAMEHD